MSNRGESWILTTGMRVWTLRISAALVVASIALAGCSTPEDLFACNLPLSCPELVMSEHYDPPEAVACGADLVTSGKPGVLLATGDPGPWVDQTQFLIILRGDGTAVLQIRERHCGEGCTVPEHQVPWETPTEQWQCSVVFPSNTPTCELDGDFCVSWPWIDFELANCTSIDPELLCNDAKAILTQ